MASPCPELQMAFVWKGEGRKPTTSPFQSELILFSLSAGQQQQIQQPQQQQQAAPSMMSQTKLFNFPQHPQTSGNNTLSLSQHQQQVR